jgi:hypothetical protein
MINELVIVQQQHAAAGAAATLMAALAPSLCASSFQTCSTLSMHTSMGVSSLRPAFLCASYSILPAADPRSRGWCNGTPMLFVQWGYCWLLGLLLAVAATAAFRAHACTCLVLPSAAAAHCTIGRSVRSRPHRWARYAHVQRDQVQSTLQLPLQVMKQVVCPVLTSLSTSTRICASGVLDISQAGGAQAGVAGLSHQVSVLLLQDIDELRSWACMAFLACPGALPGRAWP